MPIVAARFRRLAAGLVTLAVTAALATTTGTPVASAADGRTLLATAIANTRGSYLVYNFGSGHPAPLLNAAGNWYESGGGGHLMIIKAASARLAPRLLVDTHNGYQARCERTPGARTGDGLVQASEIYTPIAAWQALGQPTIAINANFFDIRGQQRGSVEVHRLQLSRWVPTWTTRVDWAARMCRSPAPSPTPVSKGSPEETRSGLRWRR